MKVKRGRGKEIDSLDDWEAWFKSFRAPEQWKAGRSAYSLADFIITRDGASCLESVPAHVLGPCSPGNRHSRIGSEIRLTREPQPTRLGHMG